MRSHDAVVEAVHAHADDVLTLTLCVPPPSGALNEVGDRLKVHDKPVCVTVTARPATVSEPLRADVDVFAPTLNPTVPAPAPFAPEVMVSQGVPLVAVHEQVAGAPTDRLSGPPDAPVECAVGDTVKLHEAPG